MNLLTYFEEAELRRRLPLGWELHTRSQPAAAWGLSFDVFKSQREEHDLYYVAVRGSKSLFSPEGG